MNSLSHVLPSRLARGAIIVSAVSLFIGVSFYAPVAQAATFRGSDTVMIPASEVVSGDIYTGGNTVSVLGTVDGDLVAGGGSVTVQGPVNKGVIAGGGTVILLGPVGGAVRVGAGDVTIGGDVKGDVIAAGGTVHILHDAHVGGDVAVAGGTITIDGTVAGKVYARGGQLAINGPVGNGIDAKVDTLALGSTAHITNGITYSATKEVTQAPGAQVVGAVTYTQVKAASSGDSHAAKAGMMAFVGMLALLKLFGYTVLALLALWLFKPFMVDVSKRVLTNPAMSGLVGFGALVMTPVALIIILCTVLGILISVFGFLMYALALMAAAAVSIVVMGALASYAFKGKEIIDWKWTILGAIAFCVLTIIPFIGWLVSLLVYLVVLGAMVSIVYEKYQKGM